MEGGVEVRAAKQVRAGSSLKEKGQQGAGRVAVWRLDS
jgi:hypothetical protein